MEYYESFLFNTLDPFTEYHTIEQEVLNDMFFDAPTWYDDIYQETKFGSLEFEKINARVVQIMDSKVGDRINDDYRKLIFPDINFKPELGSRYKFNDNVWIVYSTDNIKSVHSSCYVRRCNNTINLQDKYGNIHQEPCVVDVKPTKSGIQEYEYLSIPIARQIVMYQLNEWTKDLFINSRIMFNRQVYKIGAMMDLNRVETFNPDSIKLIKCYIDDDLVNEYDNFELQIADYKKYNYFIETLTELSGTLNEEGTLTAKVYLDKNFLSEEKVNWYSDNEEIVEVDKITGQYKFVKAGTANIYAKMFNNEKFYSIIPVKIFEEQPNIYKNVLIPKVDYISLNAKQNYEIYETLNGKKIDTKFNISAFGMPLKYYEFTKTDNSFSVKNLLQNDNNLLKIECLNLRDNSKVEFEIELGGLF